MWEQNNFGSKLAKFDSFILGPGCIPKLVLPPKTFCSIRHFYRHMWSSNFPTSERGLQPATMMISKLLFFMNEMCNIIGIAISFFRSVLGWRSKVWIVSLSAGNILSVKADIAMVGERNISFWEKGLGKKKHFGNLLEIWRTRAVAAGADVDIPAGQYRKREMQGDVRLRNLSKTKIICLL